MLTPRENAMAIYNGQQPDYYGDLMDAIQLLPDPILTASRTPQDGLEHKDLWGTVYVFKPGSPGAHPHVTDENAVIKDIEHWKEDLVVPPWEGLDWSMAKKVAEETDRREKLVGVMFSGGLFERSHHLMGMVNALCAYLEYPEEMAGMLRAIADHKIGYIREMGKRSTRTSSFIMTIGAASRMCSFPRRYGGRSSSPCSRRSPTPSMRRA